MNRKKVGIIGCGAIGSVIGEYLSKDKLPHLRLECAYDVDPDRLDSMVSMCQCKMARNIEDVIRKSDLVVECASAQIVREVLERCIDIKRDLLVLSVGGLLFCQDLFPKIEKTGIRVLVPSGAVAGIDGVKAVSIGKIKKIVLTTYKPPRGLQGVEYITQKGIDLSAIKEDTEVFCGSVREAVENFPKNINVAATIYLAAGMPKDMLVRLVVSPFLKTNVHELRVEGDHGVIVSRTENLPSPDNPRTSFMAVLSALRKLYDYHSYGLLVGT